MIARRFYPATGTTNRERAIVRIANNLETAGDGNKALIQKR